MELFEGFDVVDSPPKWKAMDENSALIEQLLREDELEFEKQNGRSDELETSDDWQIVTSTKSKRRTLEPLLNVSSAAPDSNVADVSQAIELHSEDSRGKALEAQVTASAGVVTGSERHSDDNEDSIDGEVSGAVENCSKKEKKVKRKKSKKLKESVSEAAAKIDDEDLGKYLEDISDSYEARQDIQLMQFADYFVRAFASVDAAEFPWVKMLKESTVVQLMDIPLCHISKDVYTTSIEWLSKKNLEALSSLVMWSLDSIFADLISHLAAVKESKKGVQKAPSKKSQVAIFVVLAMVLQQKPQVLVNLLPVLKDNTNHQGKYTLPLIIWIVSQASQGDLVLGLYMWVRVFLPVLNSKAGSNPKSRDLILQLLERILSTPRACSILLNGAVRNGERLVPPDALEILMRLTFPSASARVKATARFEALYPTLKDIALAGTPGSKGLKQTAHQIASFMFETAGEDNTALSDEAIEIFIWCLTQNGECYKLWDKLYLDDVDASVIILRKLSDNWEAISHNHSAVKSHREAMKVFRRKSKRALLGESDVELQALLKEAEEHCRVLVGLVANPSRCGNMMKSLLIFSVGLVLGAAAIISQNGGM